jgi:hypothetical protein
MKTTLTTLLAFAMAGALTVAHAADAKKKSDTANAAPVAAAPEQAQQVKKLVAQLSDSDWEVRRNATEALKKIGKPALPILEESLASASDDEAKIRIRAVIKGINEPPPEQFDPMKSFGAAGNLGGAINKASDPNNPLGALGGLGDLIGGMLGAASGGKDPSDMGGLLSGLLGNMGGDMGGMGGLFGMLGGMGAMQQPAAVNTGPRFVLMPPTTVTENDKKFRMSHKIVIVVEITETKDGVESRRIVIADDEDDLQKKDPEAYKVYMKNIRAQ